MARPKITITVQVKVELLTDGKRHLICRPYSLDNLHAMARFLNIKRGWFHKNHYDIPLHRLEGIEKQCKIITTRKLLSIIKPLNE